MKQFLSIAILFTASLVQGSAQANQGEDGIGKDKKSSVTISLHRPEQLTRINGLDTAVSQRFFASASFFKISSGSKFLAYDYITNCTLLLNMSNRDVSEKQFIRTDLNPLGESLFDFSKRGLISISYILKNKAQPEPDQSECINRIKAYYGKRFLIDANELGSISRHAASVLRGQKIDNTNSTATLETIQATENARKRVGRKIAAPYFLGAVRLDGKTFIVLGDPGSSIRWIAEYKNLPKNRWEFRGGIDAGFTHE